MFELATTPIQDLDIVLGYFANNASASIQTLKDNLTQQKRGNFDLDNLERIVAKLFKEGFVDKDNEGKYSITWDGKYFRIWEKGYQVRKQKEDAVLKKSKLYSLLTSYGAAFAAIFTGGLLLLEGMKFLHGLFHHSCH